MNLQSKVAIVTGANGGIGAEFSKMLVKKGATVYGLARNEEKLESVKFHLGDAFIPVKMDITKPEDLKHWVDSTFNRRNVPDILINNAGLGYFANVEDLTLEEWHTMLDVNLSGVFYLTRLIVPFMKEHPGINHIVNISSVAGLLGNPQLSGYNATKFGLRGFSEALFKELRYDGIKVTCMLPGSIATHFFENIENSQVHPNMLNPADVADSLCYILETPDNFLINEITLRPLNPKSAEVN